MASTLHAEELHLHPQDDADPLEVLQEAAVTPNRITKLTLYNLRVSDLLARAIGTFWASRWRWRQSILQRGGKCQPPLTLEILSCTGALDRVLGYFWKGNNDAENAADDDAAIHSDRPSQHLVMQHNHEDHFDVSVFVALGMGMANNHTQGKTLFRLYQPLVSQADMWALAQGLKSSQQLLELDLSSCSFPPLAINRVTEYFAEGLERNKHLRCLRLVDCQLNDEQLVVIFSALRGHPAMERIDLSGNKCRRRGLIAMVAAFADIQTTEVEMIPKLHIDLSNQSVPQRQGDDDDDRRSLLSTEAIRSWRAHENFTRRLLSLDFSGNRLCDRDLRALLELLFHNHGDGQCSTYLQDLFVGRNDFTDDGIAELARVISKCNCHRENGFERIGWKRLDISRNEKLTRQSLEQIAVSMESNLELEEICVQSTALESARVTPGQEASAMLRASEMIQYYTCLNKAGRQLLSRQQSAMPLALWPIILARVNRLDWSRWARDVSYARYNALYFLLLEGPDLFQGRDWRRDR